MLGLRGAAVRLSRQADLTARYSQTVAGMEVDVATLVTVVLEDDLDGGPAEETLRFGLGGSEYEIDLNKKNAKRFRKDLAPFIDHARKAGRGQHRRSARTSSNRARSTDIRAWANESGIPISDRGRIAASVVEQYEAATSGPLR
jgi:Lsr2